MSGIIKTINNLSNRFLYLSRNNLSRIRVEIFFFLWRKREEANEMILEADQQRVKEFMGGC